MKRILSTIDLKKDTIIRVYKKGYGYDKMKVYSTDELYLSMIVVGDFYDKLDMGDVVNCYIWIDDVVSYKFDLKVLGKIVSDKKVVFFENTDKLIATKDKECLVADVDIPISFFFLDRGDLNRTVSKEAVIEYNAKIIKLSDREATLITDELIHENELVKGHFDYNGIRMELMGKIKAIKDHSPHYLVEFIGMSDKDRCNLLDYVFGEFRE